MPITQIILLTTIIKLLYNINSKQNKKGGKNNVKNTV
jgi:hypothetical protein